MISSWKYTRWQPWLIGINTRYQYQIPAGSVSVVDGIETFGSKFQFIQRSVMQVYKCLDFMH